MTLLEQLSTEIATIISKEVKAYDIPSICVGLGLIEGEGSEAYHSKFGYVIRRVKVLAKEKLISVGKIVSERYSAYKLQEILNLLEPPQDGAISAISRRHLVDHLSNMGNLCGHLYVTEFLSRVFSLSEIPYQTHGGFYRTTLADGVQQHMVLNDDWTYKDFFELADVFGISEQRFRSLLELIAHPEVRTGEEQTHFVEAINAHLIKDGFELRAIEQVSGYPVYRVCKKGGVSGHCKNLIFAANGPKPELVLKDALNNDIQIVKNQDHCLVYDRPIGLEGLRWKDLVEWWSESVSYEDSERILYKRLWISLASEAERRFFKLYFEILRDNLKEKLPAIIPQVYLHYDPYTLRELPNGSVLARQRMDFLLLLPYQQRIVIEIDGKQHYADGDKASPSLYAKMVSEDRNLRLLGYEVYRFGGLELMNEKFRDRVSEFLNRLFKKVL